MKRPITPGACGADLTAGVRGALQAVPTLRSCRIHILCWGRAVRLRGEVQDDEQRRTADAVVRAVPGVIRVLSELRLAGGRRRSP